MCLDLIIFKFLCGAFLLCFGRTDGQDNILLNKPILIASDYVSYAPRLNDGDNSTCSWFDSNYKKFIAFDLGKVYSINKIVVSNGKYRASQPAYFYIGNSFRTCQFQNLIQNYSRCDGFVQTTDTSQVNCAPSSAVGRYLVLLKGNPFTYEIFEQLYLCEIRVYGVEATNVDPPTRPQVANELVTPIAKSYFKIAPTILNNVVSLPIPRYASTVTYINSNCEPIVFDNTTSSAFGVACQTPDGKGRIAVFAKSYYFTDSYTDSTMTQFRSNLLSWLSPNTSNAPYIKSSTIRTLNDLSLVKPGTIIYFDMWNPCPDEILKTIKSLLLNGTNPIVMEMTFWVANTVEARNSYLQIFNIFNLDFYNSFITYSSAISTVVDDSIFNDGFLGFEDKLMRVSLNHDIFLSQISTLITQMSSFPPQILQKSNAAYYIKNILSKYSKLLEWICPCDLQQTTDLNDRAIIKGLGSIMKSQLMINSGFKAPCVNEFPGDFQTTPQKNTVTLTLNAVTDKTQNPTGYYLAPGDTLDFSVSQSTGVWTMSIGCHSDYLPDSKSSWARYPSVYVTDVPISGNGQAYSPFGGVLWLYNDVAGASITVKLSNVVKTPFFNLRDNAAASKWESQKANPGLWAQIAGDSMVICQESAKVKGYSGDYLTDLMKNTWDPAVRMEMIMTYNDWKVLRPQMVVLDVMISAGYGHSGYPIELYPDWDSSVFNLTEIRSIGSWGMCHEIGHNMQSWKWTFSGTTEVTNNVLVLFVFDKLFKIPRYGSDINNLSGYNSDIKTFLDSGALFSTWKSNPWFALLIYSQLVRNLGWGHYKKVLAYYEVNNISPATNDLEMTTFMNITSIIAQQNLIPIFDFWGFSIDSSLNTELSRFPCFFPKNDFLTTLSDIRKNYIMSKYSNCNDKSSFYEDYTPGEDIKGMRANFIQEVL